MWGFNTVGECMVIKPKVYLAKHLLNTSNIYNYAYLVKIEHPINDRYKIHVVFPEGMNYFLYTIYSDAQEIKDYFNYDVGV